MPLPRGALDCGNGVKLWVVRIPASGRSFLMGSPETEDGRKDDETQHEVRFTRDWWLGVYPVTQAQYAMVMRDYPSEFEGDDLPVEGVSWNDAAEFCRKLSITSGRAVRLPTEAEWEFSCRAGTTTATHYGDSPLPSQANWSNTRTSKVGSYAPNAFGLYDMHGNVLEWCADWYDYYAKEPATDPDGGRVPQYRVLRGGCWFLDSKDCRSARRVMIEPECSEGVLGLRVAVSPLGALWESEGR